MADEADLAAGEAEAHFRASFLNATRAPRELLPKQACHNCERDLPGDRLFCDQECEQEWRFFKGRLDVARQYAL